MIILVVLLAMPLYIIGTLAPYWQRRVLIAIIVTYMLWAITSIAVYLRASASKTPLKIAPWSHGQNASEFQVHFIRYMENSGCQVTWSRIADVRRLGFAIQRKRHLVVVLCVAPNTDIREQDFSQLDYWVRETGAHSSAIIVDSLQEGSRTPTIDGKGANFLCYGDLGDMAHFFTRFEHSLST